MDLEEYEGYLKNLEGWLGNKSFRFDLTPFGEFMLHPKRVEIVKLIKAYLPKAYIMLHTNGEDKTINDIEVLMDAGLNQVIVDKYGKENKLFSEYCEHPEKDSYLYNSQTNSCKSLRDGKENKINIYYKGNLKTKRVILIDNYKDFTDSKSNKIRKLHDWLGYANSYNGAMDRVPKSNGICLYPSRQLVITKDGVVLGCCQAIGNDVILGKYPEDGSLQEIWNGKFANLLRYTLRYGLFNSRRSFFSGCKRCSAVEGGYMPFTVSLKNPLQEIPTRKILEEYINSEELKVKKYRDEKFFEMENKMKRKEWW